MLGFYLDDDSAQTAVASGLQRHSFRVVVPDEVGMRGKRDDEHLEFASKQGLVLCTSNAGDFLALHSRWVREGRGHAGIMIIVQQRMTPGEIIRRLRRLSDHRSSEAMRDWVEFLSDWGEE